MTRLVRIEAGDGGLLVLLPDRGQPLILTGPAGPLPGDEAEALALAVRRSGRINGMDTPEPTAVMIPIGGLGNFQWPALQGHRDGRDFIAAFGDWEVSSQGRATVLSGRDAVAGLALDIEIEPGEGGVMALGRRLRYEGAGVYTLDRCMAASVLAGDASHVLTFEGMWGREFQLREEALGSALWIRENRRGRTSHDRFGALMLGGAGLMAETSPALGIHLAWSGNHVIAVDRLEDGRRLAHLGELFEPGEVRLEPGAAYVSPKAVVCAGASVAAVRSAFHAHVRRRVLRWPEGRLTPRPVTLNTWEGTYFAHDLETLKAQASAAAALGIERFVLDDGWFGRRDDDTSSLGDWTVDPRKYPSGLAPLADHVIACGMAFGLWIEPEMVSSDSDLFRRHPDWALRVAGRPSPTSRSQLVLDLTRPEVVDHLFAAIDALLSAHPISYLKWDMNRDLTAAGGADGRAATGAQVRAVYALMDRIRAAHPALEIESCASGGGRADYGVLARTHRVWTSDGTDALERQEIQRGALTVLPPEIMGAHVSASPNHQTGRRHSLSFRALTALPFHFGIELDPVSLDAEAREELAAYIALHKRLRPVFHGTGPLFHPPPRGGRHVHGVIAEDLSRAAVVVAQASPTPGEQPAVLTIPHLQPDGAYRLHVPAPQRPDFIRTVPAQLSVLSGKVALTGRMLERVGIALPDLRPESALLIELIREDRPHG